MPVNALNIPAACATADQGRDPVNNPSTCVWVPDMTTFTSLTSAQWRALTSLARPGQGHSDNAALLLRHQDVSKDDLVVLQDRSLAYVLLGETHVRVVDLRDEEPLKLCAVRLAKAGVAALVGTAEIRVLRRMGGVEDEFGRVNSAPWPVRDLLRKAEVDDATLLRMWDADLIGAKDRSDIRASSVRRLNPLLRLVLTAKGCRYLPLPV